MLDVVCEEQEKVYHVHDKGYKLLFSNPSVLVGFLCEFMGLPGDAKVLEVGSLNTEFVQRDLTGRRSDRMFRLLLEWKGTRRLWLLMLEFQRKTKRMIDLRFLELEQEAIQLDVHLMDSKRLQSLNRN